jgi:hypothetical protein
LGPLGTAVTNGPIMPALGYYDDGKIGEMMIWQGDTEVIGENLSQCRFVPPQTRTRTRAAAVGDRRLTA